MTVFLSLLLSLHCSSLQAEAVRRVMSELNLTVVEMGAEEGDSGGATLEGSDVLFTGREFFVGISSHTNRRGAEVLADTFRVRGTKRRCSCDLSPVLIFGRECLYGGEELALIAESSLYHVHL